MTPREEKLQQLFALLASVTDPMEIEHLLEDLCTKKEVENMAERVFAATLLLEGKTYNQVMEKTNISSATLSRVSQCVQYGRGYSKLLNK